MNTNEMQMTKMSLLSLYFDPMTYSKIPLISHSLLMNKLVGAKIKL